MKKKSNNENLLFLVSCRVEGDSREINIEIPVKAAGYDEAIAKVIEAIEGLGVRFCFVHSVRM